MRCVRLGGDDARTASSSSTKPFSMMAFNASASLAPWLCMGGRSPKEKSTEGSECGSRTPVPPTSGPHDIGPALRHPVDVCRLRLLRASLYSLKTENRWTKRFLPSHLGECESPTQRGTRSRYTTYYTAWWFASQSVPALTEGLNGGAGGSAQLTQWE